MKSFIMKFDKDGKPEFVDKEDRAAYKLLLSLIREKDNNFTMTISLPVKRTTENQLKLWNTLIGLISMETGNDVKTIEETLINNFSKENEVVSEMSNQRFQDLLMFSTSFSQDFLNINIELKNNQFQIKKLK